MNNYIDKIYEIALIYNDKFCNKKIEYIYRDKFNKRQSLTLFCEGGNLMHLLGINFYSQQSGSSSGAWSFYKDCQNNNLDFSMCEYNEYWFLKKIAAMENISLLLNKNVSICYSGKFDKLTFHFAIRTNRNIMALTVVSEEDYYVPNSCVNLREGFKHDVPAFKKTNKVTHIKIYDNNDNHISTITTKHATPKKYNKKKK